MTILNQDIPEVHGLSHEEKTIMFAFLDKDGDGTISQDEFLDFGSVLLLNLTKKSYYATFVETNLPNVFQSNFYQALSTAVKSIAFDQKSKDKMISHVLDKLKETSNGQCVSYFVENTYQLSSEG